MRYLEIDDTTHFGMTAIGDLQRSLKRAGMRPVGFRKARAFVPRLLARTNLLGRYSGRFGHFFAPMMGKAEGSLFPYSLGMEFTPLLLRLLAGPLQLVGAILPALQSKARLSFRQSIG